MGVLSGARAASRLPGRWALEGLVGGLASVRPSLQAPPASPGSIFVLRNNDIGDLLVVTPLFDALRRRFPEARIAAGVGSWNLETLRHNPHLSEVLAVDAPWFNKYAPEHGAWSRLRFVGRSPAVAEVARRRFEVGIDVLGSAWGSLPDCCGPASPTAWGSRGSPAATGERRPASPSIPASPWGGWPCASPSSSGPPISPRRGRRSS